MNDNETGNAVVKQSLASQLNQSEFDAWQAVGGWRGALESVLPALVFVVAYVATLELVWPAILAAAVALILGLARLLARQPITYTVSGFIGVAIGVVWALMSGRGENFFAFGILVSLAYALVVLTANLAGFFVVCVALTPVWNLPWKWWKDPKELAALADASKKLSWLWFALFALRVVVQAPLWAGGHVALLGTVKLLVGLPPFLLVAWITWARLRPFRDIAHLHKREVGTDSES